MTEVHLFLRKLEEAEEVEGAAVVAEVEGGLVAVLDLCQWEACLVEECLNYDQWETLLLADQHCGHLVPDLQYHAK